MAYAYLTNASGTQFAFDMVEGQPIDARPVPDFFTRIGQTGSGAQIVGYRGEPSQITGHALFTSMASAANFQVQIMQTIGTRCRYDAPDGFAYTVLVRDCLARVVGGKFTAGSFREAPLRVECRLVLEAQT